MKQNVLILFHFELIFYTVPSSIIIIESKEEM